MYCTSIYILLEISTAQTMYHCVIGHRHIHTQRQWTYVCYVCAYVSVYLHSIYTHTCVEHVVAEPHKTGMNEYCRLAGIQRYMCIAPCEAMSSRVLRNSSAERCSPQAIRRDICTVWKRAGRHCWLTDFIPHWNTLARPLPLLYTKHR